MARIALMGLDQMKAALGELSAAASPEALDQALMASATIFRDAIRAATPVGGRSFSRTSKKTGKTVAHTAGQAKANVIIYKRKPRGLLKSGASAGTSLLVGYAKRPAFYMFWYEMGRRGQSPRKFMQDVYASAYETALTAARVVLMTRIMAAGSKGATGARG